MVQFDDRYTNTKMADLHAREEERFVQTTAPQLGFEYINLHGYTINPEAISIIPEKKAREANLVGFDLIRKSLSVAVKDPNHPKAQALLQELQSRRYEPKVYLCSSSSLEHAWLRYADITKSETEKKGVFEIDSQEVTKLMGNIKQKEDVLDFLTEIRSSNTSKRVSSTIGLIFAGALSLRVSDIHIEPEETKVRLRYRFDGVLHDIVDLEPYIYNRILSRLKLLSGMVLNSKTMAQDGRFTFVAGDREVEVRSSIIPGALGESIVMRLLDPSLASFTLERVDLNPRVKEVMLRELKKPDGLIITTGPTGSGKTTALYAFLQETHNEGVKIITIENPVEYKLEGIVQTQTGDDYTFASGLRAVLRQDPDVVMVGEIRDREVAETAIHAAQTGHLVFSTLHTNSAVAGFPRLIDLGIDPRIMGTAINVILGQRLIRILCEQCKVAYQATAEEKALVDYVMKNHPRPVPVPDPLTLYRPSGCAACGGTGFKGRRGIHEAVVMDEAVEEAIIRDPRESTIIAAAKPQGIPNMVEDGIEKIIQGVTSLKELERVIELPYQEVERDTVQQTKSPTSNEAGGNNF